MIIIDLCFYKSRTHGQVFLDKFLSSRKTCPCVQVFRALVKFSLVKSHLLESWRASFSTSLTSENSVCVHTGEPRRQTRREKLNENLPVCTGLKTTSSYFKRWTFLQFKGVRKTWNQDSGFHCWSERYISDTSYFIVLYNSIWNLIFEAFNNCFRGRFPI